MTHYSVTFCLRVSTLRVGYAGLVESQRKNDDAYNIDRKRFYVLFYFSSRF